jgi:superfamily I DNA/RNA helicase
VISRANAPLIGICLGFLAAGKPATIAGRDIGAGLLALVDKSKATTIPELLEYVDAWEKAECERLAARKRDTQPAMDRAACVEALTEGAASVAEVRARIEALFSDKDDARRIVCTTTHKAKGLERERCWILADTYSAASTEENNLWYVAITRAKTELCLIGQRRSRRTSPLG